MYIGRVTDRWIRFRSSLVSACARTHREMRVESDTRECASRARRDHVRVRCMSPRGGASATARYPCAPRRPLSMPRSLSLYDPTAPFIFMFVQFFLFLFICANSHVGFPIHQPFSSHAGGSSLAHRRVTTRRPGLTTTGEGARHSFHSSGTVVRFFCFHATQHPPFSVFFLSARRGVCQTVSSLARLFWRRASAREPCAGPNGWSHSDYSEPDATSVSSRVVSERTTRRAARS